MAQAVKGTLEYVTHAGSTTFIRYTFYRGYGPMRGESPSEVELDAVIGWDGKDRKGYLTDRDVEEIEDLVYAKEQV